MLADLAQTQRTYIFISSLVLIPNLYFFTSYSVFKCHNCLENISKIIPNKTYKETCCARTTSIQHKKSMRTFRRCSLNGFLPLAFWSWTHNGATIFQNDLRIESQGWALPILKFGIFYRSLGIYQMVWIWHIVEKINPASGIKRIPQHPRITTCNGSCLPHCDHFDGGWTNPFKNMRKSNWIILPIFQGEHEQTYLKFHHPRSINWWVDRFQIQRPPLIGSTHCGKALVCRPVANNFPLASVTRTCTIFGQWFWRERWSSGTWYAWYCWPPGVYKSLANDRINYQPQLVSRISEPSTVGPKEQIIQHLMRKGGAMKPGSSSRDLHLGPKKSDLKSGLKWPIWI